MGMVENLRMNRIFPTTQMNLGWTGQLPQYGGSDPLDDIVNRFSRQETPTSGRLQQVAKQNAGGVESTTHQQPLRFGGVVEQSNPGADILSRAKVNAEQLWNGYKQPQTTAGQVLAGSGIKPNDQDPGMTKAVENLDVDKQLNSEFKKSQINENKARTNEINNRENITEDKAWKIITITDPSNPTKQINARYNTITNKTEPIVLPNSGIITTTTKQGDLIKEKENETARFEANKAFREKSQAALDTLNELSSVDEQGNEKLNPNTQTATGWSANIPGLEYIPGGTGTGVASAHASIERLRNLLTLDLLQEIKKQSKSGATGFGQMNLRELGVLENSASKLAKMNQGEPEYAAELNRIRQKLTNILAQKDGFNGGSNSDGVVDDSTGNNTDTTPQVMEKPVPGMSGVMAVSKDGGKTWQVK